MAVCCLILTVSQSFAQDEILIIEEETVVLPLLSLSGSVDTYFRSTAEAPGTSFANLNGFSLGMVNLIAAHEGEKVGFVGDLVFGPRGTEAVFNSVGSSNIVNQLYAYYNVTDNVKLTIGNFNTFLGYEVISPTANFNYSTSYMFSYGPFSHTGLKADIGIGEGLSLMLGVFNNTDFTEFQPDGDDYYGGAQLGYEFDSGGAWLNFLVTDGFYQIDLTAGADVTDNIYVGVNATTAQDNFAGAAGYLQLATSDSFKVGARVEYFVDNGVNVNGLDFTQLEDYNVLDFTLSANYTVGNLTIIPEFRIDTASEDVFGVDDSSLTSFLLAAVYGF